MPAKAGMLIAFACAPGTTANDKAPNGRNGMFTYHLLRHITRPREDLLMLLVDVTDGVVNDTKGKQMPYTTSALTKRGICLAGLHTKEMPLTADFGSSSQSTLISTQQLPLRASFIDIHPNAKWSKNGITVAGANEGGNGINQLWYPWGLYVDDDQTIYVADWGNHRIVKWKPGAPNGKMVAGDNGEGNHANQLSYPRDVIVDKQSNSFIVSDDGNHRVVRWPCRNGTRGETIISNISCIGLTVDGNGSLYAVDIEKDAVRRYKIGDTQGTMVAGGNGDGDHLDQLSNPRYIFVDRDHAVYVSDGWNHRVMRWEEGAKQGTIVAGSQGKGNSLTQLNEPEGVVVDQLGTVYVADSLNHRIMRWPKGATQGSIIVGGNGEGTQSNQLNCPSCLSFDRHGNLYVVDNENHRVQKFDMA
ncbi:unnamed protein product [Rotaria sp. Silwood1]|nr:unnamed protein product [Rotaria sp. Silwood1]CAF1643672.1 unnamed protein product [Rotaria sp. Silwood1]CAF3805282.1 unnamed protein product [Rotaria sp. Silwood1]CAF3861401.1 unnamed protein product [Rotaria sp. Silwood1]CAF4873136.1 unnamed protein product [Rotaria sp. Silwood1]